MNMTKILHSFKVGSDIHLANELERFTYLITDFKLCTNTSLNIQK